MQDTTVNGYPFRFTRTRPHDAPQRHRGRPQSRRRAERVVPPAVDANVFGLVALPFTPASRRSHLPHGHATATNAGRSAPTNSPTRRTGGFAGRTAGIARSACTAARTREHALNGTHPPYTPSWTHPLARMRQTGRVYPTRHVGTHAPTGLMNRRCHIRGYTRSRACANRAALAYAPYERHARNGPLRSHESHARPHALVCMPQTKRTRPTRRAGRAGRANRVPHAPHARNRLRSSR